MSKIYHNHYGGISASFSSLHNAREAAICFIRYQVEIEVNLSDTVYIKDAEGNIIETVNPHTIYGEDFDFNSLTLSVVF